MSQPLIPTSSAGGTELSARFERVIPGTVQVIRSRALGFPVYQVNQGGRTLARLGRYSFLNIYFGRGQRVDLPNGATWRVGAVGRAGTICPIVRNSQRQPIAEAGPRHGHYGINGRGYAYELVPGEAPRFSVAGRWILTQHDLYLAHLTRRPRQAEVVEPIPTAALLLSFVLADFGIPGENAPRIPAFRWGS